MMAASEPTAEQFKIRLTKLLPLATSFTAVGYRSSTPKYANETDLVTGEGSKLHGGRWNPIGISMVYLSLTPETAMAETLANNRYFGIPIEDAMPRTFVAVKATLQVVLDLRDGPIRQRLQVSEQRLLTVDWRKEVRAGREPITQMIGRAAYEVGLDGLVVPSAADPRDHNLLMFPGNMTLPSQILVQNPTRLTR
jgi:RES domain-containing protein